MNKEKLINMINIKVDEISRIIQGNNLSLIQKIIKRTKN